MVSFAPLSVVKLIALVVASFDEIATCPPAIFTSLAVAALISTPPAEALISTAFVLVPAEFIITVSAPPPLAANVIPELVELILTAPDVLMPTVEEFPAMLTPPAPLRVNAPAVVEYVDAVAEVIVNGLAAIVAPVPLCVIVKSSPAPIDNTAPSFLRNNSSPTYKSFAIPTPPATVNAPVVVDSDSVVVEIAIIPVESIEIAFALPSEPIVPLFGTSIFAYKVLEAVIVSAPVLV